MTEERDKALMREAKRISLGVVHGDINPNEGCDLLGEINVSLGWPEFLSDIAMLAHEQYDHEEFGITVESCVPDIISACKKISSYDS